MPKALDEARINFREFENSPEHHDGLRHLSAGIGLLIDVIEGDYPEAHRQIAKNLMAAYKGKVILKVKGILKAPESYKPAILKYWHDAVKEFTESGLEEDQEMKSYQNQLIDLWFKFLLNTMTPMEQEFLLNELNKDEKTTIKE